MILTPEILQDNFIFHGETNITKDMLRESLSIAQERINISSQYMKENELTDRGWNNEKIARIGTLAEMIAVKYLKEQGLIFIDFTLTRDGINTQPDIIWSGNNYDVKGIDTTVQEFRVNYNAHWRKEKNVTHYIFVKLIDTANAEIFSCPKTIVTHWELKESYSKFYSFPIQQVRDALAQKPQTALEMP